MLDGSVLFLSSYVCYYSCTQSFNKVLKVQYSFAAVCKCDESLPNVHVVEVHDHGGSIEGLVVGKYCKFIIPS